MFENGDYYYGELSDGKKHGRGIFKWKNGAVYEGVFEENQISG